MFGWRSSDIQRDMFAHAPFVPKPGEIVHLTNPLWDSPAGAVP